MRSVHVLASLILFIHLTAFGQEKKTPPEKKSSPKILYSIPFVVTAETKQKLVLRGKFLETVKEMKIDGAGEAKVKVINGKKVPVGNNQSIEKMGDTELEIELELPKLIKAGISLVAISANGQSEPFSLLLRDELPVVSEKEINDGFEQAQLVPIPSSIEGTIKNDRDVDVFKFEVKKGDRLKIEVQAARFGSPLDALIGLYDSNRHILALVDDVKGSVDPILESIISRDGFGFLTIMDAHDLGGPQFGYRIVIKKVK